MGKDERVIGLAIGREMGQEAYAHKKKLAMHM
jgi:hypothetical protein